MARYMYIDKPYPFLLEIEITHFLQILPIKTLAIQRKCSN